ncbi:hypothetical protein QOZ80_1BG0058930 [Eleusine coracana subsp. coracana]|nr:hypothetical protein QOZ80_1BG0058930 [Eleusine coracana subsp. coracana]
MAAEPLTLQLVRAWVEDAGNRCHDADGMLADAAARLAPPLLVADAEYARVQVELVANVLTEAGTALASAAASMAAVEIFALRCCAPSPAAPLRSIDHLPATYDDTVRFALTLLRIAKLFAEHASDCVAWCCGRLRTGDHLLAHPGLHCLDAIVDDGRVAVRGFLLAARDLARTSADLAAAAAPYVH